MGRIRRVTLPSDDESSFKSAALAAHRGAWEEIADEDVQRWKEKFLRNPRWFARTVLTLTPGNERMSTLTICRFYKHVTGSTFGNSVLKDAEAAVQRKKGSDHGFINSRWQKVPASVQPPLIKLPSRSSKLDNFRTLIGTIPDKEVAVKAGVTTERVRQYRHKHGIAAGWKQVKTVVQAPPKESKVEAALKPYLSLIGMKTDEVVAKLAGVSRGSVGTYRRDHGIPNSRKSKLALAATVVPSVSSDDESLLDDLFAGVDSGDPDVPPPAVPEQVPPAVKTPQFLKALFTDAVARKDRAVTQVVDECWADCRETAQRGIVTLTYHAPDLSARCLKHGFDLSPSQAAERIKATLEAEGLRVVYDESASSLTISGWDS